MMVATLSLEDLEKLAEKIFRCPMCNGEKTIPNPFFEVCLKINMDVECEKCQYRQACSKGEIETCPQCNGSGYVTLSFYQFLKKLKAVLGVEE